MEYNLHVVFMSQTKVMRTMFKWTISSIAIAVKQGPAYLLEQLAVLCLVNGRELCANELNAILLQDPLLHKDVRQFR